MPNQTMTPLLLTLTQAGRLLGVSKWTVRRLGDAGELALVRVGGQLRVEPSAVDGYIEAHRETPNEAV